MLSNRHSCQLIVLIALVGATHRLGSRRSRKRQAIARQSEPRWEQPPRAMLADLTTAIPEAMKIRMVPATATGIAVGKGRRQPACLAPSPVFILRKPNQSPPITVAHFLTRQALTSPFFT